MQCAKCTPVNTSFSNVWKHLLRKIDQPQLYIPGVKDVKILSKEDNVTLRQMTLPSGKTIKEMITVEEKIQEIIFTLVDHPLFEGDVYNRVSGGGSRQLILIFGFQYRAKNEAGKKATDQTEKDMEGMLAAGVAHCGDVMEKEDLCVDDLPAAAEQVE